MADATRHLIKLLNYFVLMQRYLFCGYFEMPYLHFGIISGIPIFDDAPNLVVSLMITIFALRKESYLCGRCCVHAVYIKVL